MKPEFITFTGADDDTDPLDMLALAADYPVEFGILLSPAKTGSARYPSREWLSKFLDGGGRGIERLSAHICGDYAKEIINGHDRNVIVEQGLFFSEHFARAQINTRDLSPSEVSVVARWGSRWGVQPILQTRSAFPADRSVSWVFDQSGGRGTAPLFGWPVWSNPDFLAGFAGGLNPDNVAEVVQALSLMDGRYWIDMETGVRNADDKFDLGMCRKVCEAVYAPTSASS